MLATLLTTREAALVIDGRPPAKALGEVGRAARKGGGPGPLRQAGSDEVKHQRSCPAYERLKLLLHSGKSEIWLPGIAAATALQL